LKEYIASIYRAEEDEQENGMKSSDKMPLLRFFNLFVDPEDGSNMLLRKVSRLSTDCTALYPRIQLLHNHRCTNLISSTELLVEKYVP
jgi:hypothetical protein